MELKKTFHKVYTNGEGAPDNSKLVIKFNNNHYIIMARTVYTLRVKGGDLRRAYKVTNKLEFVADEIENKKITAERVTDKEELKDLRNFIISR